MGCAYECAQYPAGEIQEIRTQMLHAEDTFFDDDWLSGHHRAGA